MTDPHPLPASRDRLLFTPGPLTTSLETKLSMLRDLGSRDTEFVATVRRVRERLLAVAGLRREDGWESVLLQGSGTFGLEAVVSSAIPPDGRLLACVNGAYGERIAHVARVHGIETDVLEWAEDEPVDPAAVDEAFERDAGITHVALVHCETSTGLLNPLVDVGRVVRRRGKSLLVDAMSSFGGIPLDPEASGVDFLVSSANKCAEGVPGFSFVIARRKALEACAGRARTLSLDLHAQWAGFETNGQFRFTPPTHVVLAFDRALEELEREGGIAARAGRYAANHRRLVRGMRELGFRELLPPGLQSPVITAFRQPEHPRFDFGEFYRRLAELGYVIYPGKVSRASTFRIGTIGRISEPDVMALLGAVRGTLEAMGIEAG